MLAQVPIPESSKPQIRTVGAASRAVPADIALLTLNFSRDGDSPLDAGRRVAALADSLRRALQAVGIPRDSIMTPNRWYWGRNRMEKTYATRQVTVPNGPPGAVWQMQDTLYRGHEALYLRIHDLAKVGPAIDSAYAYGILEIGDLTFRGSNTSRARDEVLAAAARDARAQAATIAQASGVRLGRLLGLSTEPESRYDPFEGITLRGADASGQPVGTRVVAPSITVAATVYARWELEAGE